jgi:outer membrane receptor protein involved in Fe transport
MNKSFLLTILIMFIPITLFSQIKITGKIINQKDDVLELIEVLILNKDSIAIRSELTNIKGEFSISVEKGEYLLQVRQMGVILHKQKINLNQDLDLGIIKVTEKEQKLIEVVVTSQKKLIERKVDRLVFNVESSIAATGGDAIDALKVTPGLRIENDAIGVVGKSNIDVMVDDKKIQFNGEQLIAYLKTIRSENISRIEVITNPSAKYDASGNSGIVNIVLKKNPNLGFNGSVQSSILKNTYFGGSNGLNLNFQNERLKISWKGNISNNKNRPLEYNRIETETEFRENNIQRKVSANMYSSNLSADYKLSDKSNIGVVYSLAKRDFDNQGGTTTLIRKNNLTQNIFSNTKNNFHGLINSVNGYYNYKINDKKVSVELNYITNNTDNNVDYTSNSINYNNTQNFKKNDFKIKTAQIDFELPNSWCKIETGAKITDTDANNEFTYSENNVISGNTVFNLNEKIGALYFSSMKTISKKWETTFGLRFENTFVKGLSQSNEINKNTYNNLFPTLSVLFAQSDETSWSLAYNKRINRPNYNDLNPYKLYDTPFSYTTGNPYLKPSISNNIELSYTHNNLNLTFYGSRIENGQGVLYSFDGDFQVKKPENYYNQNSFGLNMSYTHKFFKIWESTLYADGNYNKSTSEVILQASKFEGWGGFFSSNNNVFMSKTKSLILFANYWQTTNMRQDYRIIKPNANLSMGFRYSLLEKKLQLSFTVKDIFRQEMKRGLSIIENGTNVYDNYYDARNCTISVSYKFGNNKVRGSQKNVTNDEQNRTLKE